MNEWTGRLKDIFLLYFFFFLYIFFPKKKSIKYSVFCSCKHVQYWFLLLCFSWYTPLMFKQAWGDQQFLSFLQSVEHFPNCGVFFLWDSWKNGSTSWILESHLFTKPELVQETVHNIQLHPQPALAQSKSYKIPRFYGLPGAIFILFLLVSFFPSHLWALAVPGFSLTCGFFSGILPYVVKLNLTKYEQVQD